jgi:hypothetical protein
LRRHVTGGPFEKYFTALLEKKSAGLPTCVVEYRKSESLFVVSGDSKITIIFLIDFADVTDKALAKIFLQVYMPDCALWF